MSARLDAGRIASARVESRPGVWPRGWSVSERKVLLLLGDLVIVLGAMLVTQVIGDTIVAGSGQLLQWTLLLAVVWITLARALDCYDLVVAARLSSALGRVGLAGALTFGVYLLIPYWSPTLPTARWVLLLNAALVFGPLLTWRAAYALLLTRPAFRVRALILGRDRVGMAVAELLHGAVHDYELLGILDCAQGSLADRHAADELIGVVQSQRIHELIVSTPTSLSSSIQAALIELAAQGVTIVSADQAYESMAGRVLLPCTDSTWLATLPVATRLYEGARRLVDILAAGVGLVALTPLLLLATLAVVLDSPGGPLYWQERTGRYGRQFRIVKLRTMVQDAEADGRPVWAQERDPRVTRVGALLRHTRLDEAPQLWNVFRGEMSLVGPRPERPDFVGVLTREVPMYRARHVVRPGITGWAQVKFGYGSSMEDAFVKLQYDLYYIRHRSPLLDVIILLKTIAVVLRFRGT